MSNHPTPNVHRITIQQMRRELAKMAGRLDSIRADLAAAARIETVDPHGTMRADLAEHASDCQGWADVLASYLEQDCPNAAGILARIEDWPGDTVDRITELQTAAAEWLAAPACEHLPDRSRFDARHGIRCAACERDEHDLAASEYAKENPQ